MRDLLCTETIIKVHPLVVSCSPPLTNWLLTLILLHLLLSTHAAFKKNNKKNQFLSSAQVIYLIMQSLKESTPKEIWEGNSGLDRARSTCVYNVNIKHTGKCFYFKI